MKQITEEWIYLTISAVSGIATGITLALLREILGTF